MQMSLASIEVNDIETCSSDEEMIIDSNSKSLLRTITFSKWLHSVLVRPFG